ncbi:MAG: alpha/beta hydrolase [Paludibacteraceae bacterium]|nr:alpha/beta hydrolase [Paludibacteraceae bacterium]
MLTKFTYTTPHGIICYWKNDFLPGRLCLVFLPGLSVDHTLFEKQIDFFGNNCNILTWDAPGHVLSRPFKLNFSLEQEAQWLHEIVIQNGISNAPLFLIGQSKGGFLAMEYMSLFPHEIKGVVSIDSGPIERVYFSKAELWILKHLRMMFRIYPINALKKEMISACSETEYGQVLMQKMYQAYGDDLYDLLAYGFKIIAESIESHTIPIPECPVLIIMGENDRLGGLIKYNRRWAARRKLPFVIVPNAKHNSNNDNYEFVNRQIQAFIETY